MHIDKWECCYSQRDTRFCIGVWKKRLQTRFFDSMMDGALATSTPFANNTNKMHMPAQMLCTRCGRVVTDFLPYPKFSKNLLS